MHAMMESCWNAAVDPGDTVYYLGDFAMNPRRLPVRMFSSITFHIAKKLIPIRNTSHIVLSTTADD
jgi:calcineurin-like phosphoesterase family protein